VSRFLCEYLAAREMCQIARTSGVNECKSTWIRASQAAFSVIKSQVNSILNERSNNNAPLPMPLCRVTREWVSNHSRQQLSDAFKSIRSWLAPGWALQIEKRKRTKARSIAMF